MVSQGKSHVNFRQATMLVPKIFILKREKNSEKQRERLTLQRSSCTLHYEIFDVVESNHLRRSSKTSKAV